MSPPIRLAPHDAERYARLRRQMLDDTPWAFDATPDDDRALDVAHIARVFAEEHAAVLAFEASAGDAPRALVAAAGVARRAPPKFDHRVRVWGAYVEPGSRGRGLGRALLVAAVELARSWRGVEYVDLSVSANSPEAMRLYESLGFRAWGREPDGMAWQGHRFDEIYMTRRL